MTARNASEGRNVSRPHTAPGFHETARSVVGWQEPRGNRAAWKQRTRRRAFWNALFDIPA